jgi:pimeloyl-ACP methyl ester carboxylesterase
MLTEKTFEIDTVSIHYAEGPASGLPLVLVHGGSLRWQDFLPVLPLLSFRYHTYALDLRGHGRSGRMPGAYRIDQFAEDVEQFLHERVTEPAVLLGYSMGAHIAMEVAARTPARLIALILAEPAPYLTEEQGPDSPFFQRWRAYSDLMSTQPSLQDAMARLAQLLPGSDGVYLRSRAQDLMQLDPDVLTHIVENKTNERFHPDELLAKITCPVLLLQGDPAYGGLLDDPHVERMRSQLADCTHVRIPQAGHNLHTPQPTAFYQVVSRFLESLEQPSGMSVPLGK